MRINSSRLLAMSLCCVAVFTLAQSASAQDFMYHPLSIKAPGPVVSTAAPNCGALPSKETLTCYTPEMIKAAYNGSFLFPSPLNSLRGDGSGQTIAIIEAYGSPTLAETTSPNYSTSDLAVFDSTFGLPDPPSLTIVCPAGCPVFNPSDTKHEEVGWSLETTLDVEYAHAMAPGASIALVVAATSMASDITAAEQYAITHISGVSVLSQSFGAPEFLLLGPNTLVTQAHANFEMAQTNGITVLTSAGNLGATDGAVLPIATFPASDPLVTAVGGTEGFPHPASLYASGGYGTEQVWNEADLKDDIIGATGGAPSLLFPVPSFQKGLHLRSRTIPDVSFNAAVNGGVLVYWSALGGSNVGLYVVGGTGAAAPQWAGIIAIANQLNTLLGHAQTLGYINPAIYEIAQGATAASDFHDITEGNNRLFFTFFGYRATTGYDFATGWGTPNIAKLVPELVNTVYP